MDFLSGLIGGALGAAIGAPLIFFLLRSFVGSYLAKKGENLATKQDISELTHKQEAVKAEFAHALEMFRSESQLRMAVVEQRFAAHQEAHTLWIDLYHNVYDDEVSNYTRKCEEWWERNSLYLDPEARSAFKQAVTAVHMHKQLLNSPRNHDQVKLIVENWKKIEGAGPTIEAAVNLPSLDASQIKRPGEPEPTAMGDEGSPDQ